MRKQQYLFGVLVRAIKTLSIALEMRKYIARQWTVWIRRKQKQYLEYFGACILEETFFI